VRLQDGGRAGVEGDSPFGVGLGVLLNDAGVGLDQPAADRHLVVLEVDVLPLERAELTAASTCRRGETEEHR
jgi:hypothetical protein